MEGKLLQTAVQQLISHHTDFKLLLKEIEPEESDRKINKSKEIHNQSLTVESIVNSVKQHACLCGANPATDTAIFISQKFKELLHSQNSNVLLNHLLLKNQVLVLIDVVKYLYIEGSLSRQQFTKHITTETVLPIDVIWMFHTQDIMSLDEFITCNKSRPKVIGKLAHDIPEICSATEVDVEYRRTIINDIMMFLLNQGYVEPIDTDNPASRGMKKVSCALLDSITKKILQDVKEKDVSVFMCLMNLMKHHQVDSIKKYCTRQITLVLSFNPHFKVSDALIHQSKWSFAKTDPYKTKMYRELLLQFSTKEAIKILQQVLEEQEVNWEAVLSFAATLLLCYSDAPNLLQLFSVELITAALEKSELDGLIVGFLLARQAAIEGPHVFQSYHQWFYTTFGEQNTSPANNKKTFTFLMKFFSDIVPYENVQHLRAHIWKQLYVPPKCRSLLSDYVSLVKTRLMDLGEPLEEISIFSEGSALHQSNSNVGDSVMSQARNDVEKAITNFERNGKIPASIMEASIFRKPYFVGRFLPALLATRPLPDKPDSKMMFIEALHKTDKIPHTLYSTYVNACERISKQLLEGVFFEADDECMEDLLLTPWEQYKRSLENVIQVVGRMLSSSISKNDLSYESVLSVFYEKLCVFLKIEDCSSFTELGNKLVVDILHPSLCESYLKVVDSILSSVTAILSKEICSNYTWLTQLIECVCRNIIFHKTLCVRLWYLICKEETPLNDPQIRCIASVYIVLIQSTSISEISMKLDETEIMPFHEAVVTKLNISTKCWMTHTLKYLTYYMEHIFMSCVEEIVASPVQEFLIIFSFLVTRVKFSEQYKESHFIQVAWFIYKSKLFQQCALQQLNMVTWLDLELQVNSTDDILDDVSRQKYYSMMIFTEFLPKLARSEKNAWADYFCTKLALALICHKTNNCIMKCPHNKSQEGRNQPSSKFHLINLLQHLTHFLGQGQQQDPWLVQLYKLVQENTDTQKYSEVEALELGSQLSPYLLFVNTLQPHVPCSNLDGTVHIINHIFRELETQGQVLAYPTTVYVIQALASTQHLPLDWEMLLDSCPLIPASIQYHWSCLEDCSNNILWKEPIGSLIKEINAIDNAWKRYISAEETDLSHLYQCNHFLLAFAILSYLQTCNDSSCIYDIVIKIPELCSNIITAALSLLSWGCIHNQSVSKETKEILLYVFMKYPEGFIDVDKITHKMCSTACQKIKSTVFLRDIMHKINKDDMRKVLPNSTCVRILLEEYNKCTQMYEMGTESYGPISRISSLIQPLTLSFLHSCEIWINENLKG